MSERIPQVIIDSDGNKIYKHHIGSNLYRYYKADSKTLHRLGGPAVEDYSEEEGKYESWYKDGKLHRLDGPANSLSKQPNRNMYVIDGKVLSKDEFIILTKKIKDSKDLHTTIDLTKI